MSYLHPALEIFGCSTESPQLTWFGSGKDGHTPATGRELPGPHATQPALTVHSTDDAVWT
jgi:hypothetical protein